MGKSALIARFLDDLREAEPAAVRLAGRCFEQESVPYKALDSAVDALGRHLRRMGEAEVNALLPRDIATLARLFPALLRIPAVESAPRRAEDQDQFTQRRRAFGALRELFARLGDRTSLALVIDDLQWGDADSSALLLELLRPPDAPRMLVVLAYRADEAEQSECLRALLPALRALTTKALALSEVAVEELDETEARDLALSELARSGAPEPSLDRAAVIVSEAGGSPFFIRELCRTEGVIAGAQPSLDAMLWARIASLPEEPRRLLEMIAVAGRPIERGVAVRAAALGDGGPSTLVLLRNDRLVRVLRDRSRDEIEAYHDRIRETVKGRLAAETKKGHHLALAAALLDTGGADEETLAVHFEGAGDAAKAAEHAVKAADQAMAALGFDRAARLYRQAIAAMSEDGAARRTLHEKLGAALGYAGRGPEAAAAYLAAVDVSVAERALELRRRAAEHYLTSGHIEEGLSVLRAVLAATGLSMPATRLGALIRLLPLVVLLWLRGLRFHERPEHEIPAEDLLRIDACAAVASGLMAADPLLSMCFHKRFLWLSLRAGDPYRVLRALIVEAGFYAAVGASEIPSRRAERLDRLMVPLLSRFRGPSARFQALQGAALAMRGSNLVFRGQLRQAREHLERAIEGLTGPGAHLGNEVALTSTFLVQVLFVLGEWREAFRRQAAFLEEARARGDLFLEVTMSQHSYVSALIEDRPDAASEVIERAKARWPRADPSRHYTSLMAHSMTALYREAGAGDGALLLVTEAWPALARSGLFTFSGSARIGWLSLRGRAYLAAAAGAPPSRSPGLLRAASRDARALGRVRLRVAAAWSASLRAGVAVGQGDRDRALELLAEAEAGFLALDMALDVAASRRRRGEILGAEDGRALIASADAVMSAQDIRNPARMTAMFLPGKW
jgi:eukaryotic-like serine/threonine-protein kinase